MPDSADIRILFVGDMHLGCLPAGLPRDLRGDPEFGPAGAWRRVVDTALEQEVHAVALAGDLVHQANAAFGAYGPLREGVARLAAADIPVCAVAGNHDAATLPSLAGQIEGFTLLGAGGTWSALEVGAARARIVGWSFPGTRYYQSPFAAAQPPTAGDTVTLGLLHCDLNKSRGPYAPVSVQDLRTAGYDRWFLGHEHVPGDPAVGDPFYLGSLTPLDASETGLHGPVLVRVDAAGGLSAERLPLAPVRWEKLEIPCGDETGAPEQMRDVLLAAVAERCGRIASEQPQLRAAGFDVTFTGRVDRPDRWDRTARSINVEDLRHEIDGTHVFVRRVDSRLMIRRDLHELAAGDDPAGLLARRVLALENPGTPAPGMADTAAEADRLVAAARGRLGAVDRKPYFGGVEWEDPDRAEDEIRAETRAALAQTARRLLDRLLAQRGGDDATD